MGAFSIIFLFCCIIEVTLLESRKILAYPLLGFIAYVSRDENFRVVEFVVFISEAFIVQVLVRL
jgi:hypothetical protein